MFDSGRSRVDVIKKIVFVVGVIALLILWKTYLPQTWSLFWDTVNSLITPYDGRY